MSETDRRDDAQADIPPAFSDPIPREALEAARKRGHGRFSSAASADQRAALAQTLGLESLDALSIDLVLDADGGGGWRVDGRVQASYAQLCGVTLERLERSLDERLDRIWTAQAATDFDAASEDGLSMAAGVEAGDAAFDDGPDVERTPAPIDLGAIASETLSLAIDPFPRAEGADFDEIEAVPPGASPIDAAEAHPFAALSRAAKEDDGA